MENFQYTSHQLNINLSEKDAKSAKGAEIIKQSIEKVMTQYASAGWEFDSQISIPITVSPGCLGGLTGAKAAQIDVPVLVFRRRVQGKDFV
ncbi:MAG: hypothetical protein HRU41_31035 [Saprospiraceae bacterium]|nr:hypothetical protein [Saprospiraceae bacterium]